MFANLNKPTFGQSPTTSSFSGFGTQQPFGQTASTNLFSGPTQPNIFQNAANTFGTTTPAQPGFGQTSTLFGQQNQPSQSGGLFGSTGNAFGQQNKPTGFGFVPPPSQPGGLFAPQQPAQANSSTSLFQQNTNIFGQSTPAFGASTSSQTGTVYKFNPVTGTDTMQKNGVAHSISTKHHCITTMKEYEGKSLEELRFEDYSVNRKEESSPFKHTPRIFNLETIPEEYPSPRVFQGPQQQSGFGATAPFGTSSSAPSLFGQPAENKPFGQTTTGFGQPTTGFGQTNTGFGMQNQQGNISTLFGKTNTGFGTPATTRSTFGTFGVTTSATSLPFGQQTKPFGTTQPLFGATPTTQTSTFGTGGIFSQQTSQAPAPSLFGKTTQPTTVFGQNQNTGFSFNQPQTTQSTGGLFQTLKPETSGFTSLFGQTQQPTSTFGQTNTFGLQQPSFGTNTFGKTPNQTTFNPSFGMGMQQQQPQNTSLFGNPANKVGGLFSNNTLGQPNLFSSQQFMNQPNQFAQPQQANPQSFPTSDQQTEPNLGLLTHSPFPVSPHLDSLEIPTKTEPAKYTTNRTELMSLLQGKQNIDTTPTRKIKLLPPRSSKPSLFEGMSANTSPGLVTSSQKRLVIKPIEHKASPLFSPDDELLDIIAERNKKSEDSPRLSTISTNSIQFLKANDNKSADPGSSFLTSADSTIMTEHLIKSKEDTKEVEKRSSTSSVIPSESRPLYIPDALVSSKSDLKESSDLSIVSGSMKSINSRSSIHSTLDKITTKSLTSVSSSKTGSEDNKHPCGIILTRPEYYTVPPLEELSQYLDEDGSCIIKGFTIGRMGYGNVYFPDPLDISNLNIDEVVFFRHREICVYPDDTKKPPLNTGLNRRAQVTLDDVYPRDPDTNCFVKDIQAILESDFVERLKSICNTQGVKFLDYRPESGSWVFDVNHFSIYGFGSNDDRMVKKQKEAEQPFKTNTDENKESEDKEMTGLGGQLMEEDTASNILDLSSKVYQQELLYTTRKEREEARNVEVLTKAFFTQPCTTYSEGSLMMDDNEDYLQHMIDLHEELSMVTMGEGKLLPQFPRPKISVIKNRAGEIAPSESMVKNLRCALDLNIFAGKSFKPCFLKGFKFIDLSSDVYIGRHATSTIDIKEINNSKISTDNFSDYLIKALQITQKESVCAVDKEGAPLFQIKVSPSYLSEQNELFNCIRSEHIEDNKMHYYDSMWKLCHALWGPLDDENDNRRDYLAEWLQLSVIKTLDDEWKFKYSKSLPQDEVIASIFQLLSMRRVYDAAELAMNYEMPELSLLISQLGSTEEFRANMRMTIAEWYNSFTKDYMDPELKKIYLILSGNAVLDDINICKDIDWKRALGLLLWYVAPAHATIQECLTLYIMAFQSETESYAVKPHPPYAVNNNIQTGSFDALYHILYLYCSHSYILDHVLNPLTHTSDPTDHRMSWLLLQMFKSIQKGVMMDSSETMVHTNFAQQLESLGKWEWSIFVLLFIKDNHLKKKLVIDVLERNVSTDVNENAKQIDDFLVNELNLPPEWIHSVKAYKCESKGKYWDCYLHFTYAKLFYKAHEVFVEHIQPHLFISRKHDELKIAVAPLQPFANEIITWNNEIGLILDFFTLNAKFEESNQELDFKKLHKELMILCKKLNKFRQGNGIQKLCVAELSKKCALLQRLIVDKLKMVNIAQSHSNILHNLIMPPDYLFLECMHYMIELVDN